MANRYIVEEHVLPGVGGYNGDTHYVPINEKCWRINDTRNDGLVGPVFETQELAQAEADRLNHKLG